MAQSAVIGPDGEVEYIDLTPEEEADIARIQQNESNTQMTKTFETQEDAERLRVIYERAREDPAYKALADVVLSGKGL